MDKLKKQIPPEDIFSQALDQAGPNISDGDMRLLLSGLAALRAAREKPLNKNELSAVKSLIAYVAYTQNVTEAMVETILMARYEVSSINALVSKQYNDIVEFLIDVQMKTVVN